MMKKLSIILLLSLLLFIPMVYGANSTTLGDHCITITGLDEDWTNSTCGYLPSGYHIDVARIVFYSSGTSDVMIIHDGGIDADPFFDSGYCADTYDHHTYTFDFPKGNWVHPIVDISDCTLNDASEAKVKIYFR